MYKLLFSVFTLLVLNSCTKQAVDIPLPNGELSIDLQQNDVNLRLSRVNFLTDSINFNFESTQDYNCDRYRLNLATQINLTKTDVILGNTYRIGGYCTWGAFPATAQHKSAALELGEYILKIKKGSTIYLGKIIVTPTNYTFDWEYDNILRIEPKVFTK